MRLLAPGRSKTIAFGAGDAVDSTRMIEQRVAFDVETFAALHTGMDPTLTGFARAALSLHGASPRSFRALRDGSSQLASVSFMSPDRRTEATYERERIVEFGAIVLAGLLLHEWEGKQITRVVRRGGRVDYFVGKIAGDVDWILEVGGTDSGVHQAKRSEKLQQLRDSFYRRPPFRKDGFAGATRFAEPAVTSLDAVPAEAS
jgi:hypothetical protein